MHSFAAIHIHVVFATWDRRLLLHPEIRPDAHAAIAAVARTLDVSDVVVGGVADHVHMLGRFDPSRAMAEVIGQVKKRSGDWIRDRIPLFRWQRGYGAFGVSPDRVRQVARYVARQEEHHHARSFRTEMEELCRDLGLSIDSLNLR